LTLYLNMRAAAVGGPVIDPYVLEGDGTTAPQGMTPLAWDSIAGLVRNRNVLMATHGFNVSYASGLCSLGRLEAALGLSASDVYFGVLWPGDFWLPAINYPFEGATSINAGRRLATFCNKWLAPAKSLSFASHSLGARLVLETTGRLTRPAKTLCLTAGAINDDCLDAEYAGAASNAAAASVLASRRDTVLSLAFPPGDIISDLLHGDHKPGRAALGYDGPAAPVAGTVSPTQIPDKMNYGHGDYLPPGDPDAAAAGGKWRNVAGFIARAFRGEMQSWP